MKYFIMMKIILNHIIIIVVYLCDLMTLIYQPQLLLYKTCNMMHVLIIKIKKIFCCLNFIIDIHFYCSFIKRVVSNGVLQEISRLYL